MLIKYLKMPKKEAKFVKISIWSLSEVLSEKVPESRPPIKSNFKGAFFLQLFLHMIKDVCV